MVEYAIQKINLDVVFASLADATRRDILLRVLKKPHTIGELADVHTEMSFAAIAKHIGVLEGAQLVEKKRAGRQQIVNANPKTITAVSEVLKKYEALWEQRFDALEKLLAE